MEGSTFGDVPLNLEMKLEVWDSPNSAGVVIDAVRCAKLGLDHGLKGALVAPSSYFKKSPPYQFPDEVARELTESFIKDPAGSERKLADRLATTTRNLVRNATEAARNSGRKPARAGRRAAPSANGRMKVGAGRDVTVNEGPANGARAPRRAGRKPARAR